MQVIPKPPQAVRERIDELQEFHWIDRNQQTREGKRGGNTQCRNQLGGISRSRIHVLDSSRRQGQRVPARFPDAPSGLGGHLEHHWQPFRLTLFVATAPAFGEVP